MSEKPNVVVTLFYMTGCRFCEEFKEEWGKLEERAKTDSKLEKLNVKTIAVESKMLNKEALAKIEEDTGIKVVPTINGEDFRGFPTIKIEVGGKEYNYSGNRTAEDIILFIMGKASKSHKSQDGGGKVDYRKKYKKWKTKYAVLLKKYKNSKKN